MYTTQLVAHTYLSTLNKQKILAKEPVIMLLYILKQVN